MAEPIPQGTMIVKDPWEEAFASYHQSLVDLDGDGVPDVAVPITVQGRRQVQRRAMAGLEPTPQQAAGLAADMPRLERNSETMADIGAFGASMLLPMGPVAKAVQYAPRTAGVLASTLPGFAALNSDEAEAQKATGKGGAPITPQRDEQGILNAIGDNAALKALYDQIRQAESRASGQVPGVNRESSDRIRGEAASQAAELRKQLNAELLKIQQSKAPFRDTAVGQMWPYVQAGAPILAGLAVKGGQNLLANRGPKALDNALLEFEKLRARGGTPGDLSYAAGKVGSIADDIKPPPQTMGGRAWETVRDTGPATIAGGTVGAELNLLPYQYDRRNAPVGSPAHTEAEQQLSAENWGRNALLGLGIGALGGQTASHLGQFGKRRAALGEAENIRRYESIPAVGQMSGDEVAAIAAQAEAVAQAQMLAGRQQALQGIRNAAPPNVGFTDLEMLTSSLIPRARVGEVPVPGGPGPGGPGPGGPGPGGPSGRGLPSGGGGGPGPLPSGPSGGLPDIPPAPPPSGPPHPTPRNPQAAQQGLAEYTNRLLALQNGPPALTYTPNARFEAVLGGMNSQRGGAVRPEANPYGAGGVAQREAAAAERGRFRMERNARAADELASPTNQRINRDLAIDQTAQNVLGNVGRAAGAADDAIAQLPRGAYERALANEPTLQILAQNYGMTIDDIVAALARRGYAVPPNARFNANVMQQYQSGRSGALPMTAEEKSFRDAMHRRNRRPEGGQRATGDAF